MATPWWKHALVWGVGLGLLGWMLDHVPQQTVWQALRQPSAATWALTLSALVLSYGLRAGRLQVVTGLNDCQDATPRWLGLRLDALRVILMHNAAVNLLPMRAGELSFPYLASREMGMPLARALASLLWMRLQDLAVLMSLGLLCWPTLPWSLQLGGLTLVVLGWHLGVWLLKRLHTDATPDTRGWRMLVNRLHDALLDPHHHQLSTWAFTWANWSIKLVAGAWLIASITGLGLRPAWAGALGGELAAIAPVQGPAGLGTYEAGVWAGLHLGTGIDLQAALPAALALHLCFLCCAVLAGLLAWAFGARLRPREPSVARSASSSGNPD
jgi:Lysylphosphatidylglycerol synthase TM region